MPNELTLEQNLEIVDRFIKNHLASNYYAYAIHEKAGELSGERHPHVHIMFSERLIDDVERVNERPACKYFRRAAKPLKGEKVASFERRREHGAPKDKKWHDKKFLFFLREDFARIQNDVLKKHGFSIRVDHRTLNAQQVEAEKNGDDFLAKLYKRVPESYIGIIPAHKGDSLCDDVKRYRKNVREKQHSLFIADFNRKAMEEAETLLLVQQAESAGSALIDSPAYKSTKLNEESLRDLNQNILAGLMKIYDLRLKLVGYERAKEQAQKEYLPATDYQFIRGYESKLNQRAHLERILKEISPATWYPDNERVLRYIESRVKEKNSELRTYLAQHNPHYWTLQEKLQRPYLRKNIELVIHGLLQNDLKILAELKKESKAVLQNVDEMRNKIETHEPLKTTFTLSEIRDDLREQYFSLKKQYEEAVDTENCLMLQQASPIVALSKAKNIFVHGDFDKLHVQQKLYEETLEQYEHDKSHYLLWEREFHNKKWANSGDRLREHYYLTKKKIHLEETEQKLAATKILLDRELTRLEILCQTEAAKEKIALLAADILYDNSKISQEYEAAKKLVTNLSKKLKAAKKRFKTIDENFSSMKQNRLYRVIQSASDSSKTSSLKENELINIIADALLGEPYALPIVARFGDNNLETEKEWEMMTDFDKDEIIRKKIIREL